MKKQTVFVTGGAGYIGSHVVYALEDSGYDVVVYDNLSTGFKDLVSDSAQLIIGDILDKDSLSQAITKTKPDALMHFAAKSLVKESVEQPLSYMQTNIGGTLNVLDACKENDIRTLVFSSTAAVYGEPDITPIPEDARLNPINPYGVSKLMMEQIIQNAANEIDLRYAILRYFNVAGADPKGRSGECLESVSHLIHRASKTANGEYPDIKLFGTDYDTPDGTCVRDYIHVSDLANAHVSALVYLLSGKESTILNCGYKTGYSVKEVLSCCNDVLPQPLKIIEEGRREGDPASLVADNTKILKTLNWQPQYNYLTQIVTDALAWEKNPKRPRS